MGFVHKGGVWWFLLLAGVLLAAAAAGAEQDDGVVATAFPAEVEGEEVVRRVDGQGNDMCDIKCQHHQVPARKQQCVDECHSREHHHPSRASCETKCSHWQDPTRKEQCVQQCMRYGLNLDVGGSNGVDERPHTTEEEVGRRVDDHGNDMCDIKCQHHQVPARKKQCVDECHSREHHHPSRAACESKCSHWADPTRKEQCVQQCMSYGLGLHVGGGEHLHGQEEEVGRRACDSKCQLSCEVKCINWKDRTKHLECVRQCISGSNSADEQLRRWEAVAGAIIEVA